MKFKNGFKVGMVIASPIVLMSTYAAPCFAAGTSVFITKLDTDSENIDISSLSMQESDKIVYGADLSGTTVELDSAYYTITGSNLKLTAAGLKKIYGDESAESITKGLEVKLGLKPTSGDTKLICTIVFPAKEVDVKDLSSNDIGFTFDGKTIDSANDFSVTFGNSNTPLDGRTDYTFTGSEGAYTGIKFTAAGLQKIYEGTSITADKDVTVTLINTTSGKAFNLEKKLKFKKECHQSTVVTDLTQDKPITVDLDADIDTYVFGDSKYTLTKDTHYNWTSSTKTLTFTPAGLKEIYGEEAINSVKHIIIYAETGSSPNFTYTPVGMLTFGPDGTDAKEYYYLNFDLNYTDAPKMASELLITENTEEPSAPTREGYTFGGWYKEAACTNTYGFGSALSSDITLYAKWKPNVTFNLNYTDAPTATVKPVESGSTVTALDPAPTRTGYTFDGWYTSNTDFSDSKKWNFDSAVSEPITLYAKWVKDVTDLNATDISITLAEDVIESDVFKFGDSKIALETGDYTISDDNKTLTFTSAGLKKIYNIVMTKDASNSVIDTDKEVKIYKNETEVATLKFKKIEYTVTFNLDEVEGSVTPFTIQVVSGATVPEPSFRPINGYTLEGWYTADGTKFIFKGDANATPVTADIANNGTITLYARGIQNIYTVTFNFNDGTGLIPPNIREESVVSGATVDKPSDPTRPGYTFEGWYKEQKCINLWNFGEPVADDITLYAKWIRNIYTVTFDANAPDGKTADDVQNMPTQMTSDNITEPANPTLEGYTFGGWYTSDTDFSDSNKWDFASEVTESITLYAKWIKIPVLEVSDFEQENVVLNFIESYTYNSSDVFKFGDTALGEDDIELVQDSKEKNKIIGIKFTEAGLKKIYGDEDAEAILSNEVVEIKAVHKDENNNVVEQIIGRVSFKATDTADTDKDDDNNSTGSSSSDSEGNSNGSSSNAGSSSSKTSGTKRGSGTRTGEAFMGLQGLAAMISAGLGLFISKRRKK